MAKRGLKSRDVSREHFSSGIVLDEPKFSRLIVRFIEGKDLLASDISTGKSDPVSFVWCGPVSETPNLEEADMPESGILRTSVCPTTVNPIWNEDVIFPLDITDIVSFLEMKCLIYVRDEDPDENGGATTYDELGMLELPFKDIFSKGKALKNSVVVSGAWYTLNKSPGMRRVDGALKITLTVIFSPDDNDTIAKQLPAIEDQGTNFSRASLSQLHSISHRVQSFLANPTAAEVPAEASKVDPKLRLALTGLGRPSTAKASSRSSTMVPNIAPMVRRPSTAPQKRMDEHAQLEPAGRVRTRRLDEDRQDSDLEEEGLLDNVEEEEQEEEELGGDEAGGRWRRTSASNDKDGDEDELIVLSGSQYARSAKKDNASSANDNKNSAKSSKRGSKENVSVDIGGYELNALLDADGDGAGRETMENIVKLGVQAITQKMGADALNVDAPSEAAAQGLAKKLRATAHGLANEAAEEMDVSPVKEPLQAASDLPKAHSDPPAPSQEEDKAKSADAEEQVLTEGPAGAGDEGVLEDILTAGVRAVAQAINEADIDYQDTLQAAGKMVAKRVKGAAQVAVEAVRKISEEQASNLTDDMLPGKDISEGRKEGADGQNSRSNAGKPSSNSTPSSAVSGVRRSPRQGASEKKVSPEKAAIAAARLVNESFGQPSGEEAFLHLMSSDAPYAPMGDRMENPGDIEEADPEQTRASKSQKRQRTRPHSSPGLRSEGQELSSATTPGTASSTALVPAADSASAATAAHLALQADLKQQAQGHATAVVRALKEMTSQRKIMEQSLEKIAQATAVGFSKLSDRISHLEEALMGATNGQERDGRRDQLLLMGPDSGDQDEAPLEEEGGQDENRRSNRLNGTAPARIQTKATGTANTKGKGKTGVATTTKASTAPGKRAGATSSSPPPRRPQTANSNNNSSGIGAPKQYGNVGAIAQAKAAARAAKKKQRHPPFATFEDGASTGGASNGSTPLFHFQPKAQLMFRGADGQVEASQLAEPPAPDMMSPGLPGYPQPPQAAVPSGPSRPYTGAVVPYQGNSGYSSSDYSHPQHQHSGGQDYYSQQRPSSYGHSSNGAYSPGPAVQPVSTMAFQSAGQQHAGQQAVKYPLNRDFAEVLERGSLEDVARMVESTAPRPEDLSASVRNRLYDAIATLLHQNSHTERCLIWVLALVRGPRSLLAEVVGHTVRDLKEALENVALEASKRGLLASLLKSQIHR